MQGVISQTTPRTAPTIFAQPKQHRYTATPSFITSFITMQAQDKIALHTKLVQETAQIAWIELQRYFATGAVIYVSDNLDLIDVAMRISNDDKAAIEEWMQARQLGKVSDNQAQEWLETEAIVWSVVVSPWILVQQKALA
ncbi:MAG: DUF2288 domain-containing protein [Burkholderiaceae bacterium]